MNSLRNYTRKSRGLGDTIERFTKTTGIKKLTKKTGINARINFSRSMVTANGKNYPLSPIGVAAQEMIITGGLENWVKERI